MTLFLPILKHDFPYEKFEKKWFRLKTMHNCISKMLGIRNLLKQIRRNKHIDSQPYSHLKFNSQINQDKEKKNLKDV
jgi:ribosomal protein L19E